jgi:hypothetical protein
VKALPLGLLTNPVTAPASYDQTKPFYSSRLSIKPDPISGVNSVGVLWNQIYDLYDDTAATGSIVPVNGTYATPNGRLFQSLGFTGAVLAVAMYSFNSTTGVKGVYLGQLKFTFFAATNTLKSITVDDTNPNSMIFAFTVTNTTVANGGLFSCHGVPTSDFVLSSFITYPLATSVASLTKTVYQNVDVIGANTLTVGIGHDFDYTSGGTISSYYVMANTAPLPKVYKFNLSTPPSGTVTAGAASSNFTLATGTFGALGGAFFGTGNTIRCGKLGHTALSGTACLTVITTTTILAFPLSQITSGNTNMVGQVSTTLTLDLNKYASSVSGLTPFAGQYDQLTDRFYMFCSNGRVLVKQIINNDPNGTIFGTNDVFKEETGSTTQPSELGGLTNISMCMQNGWLFASYSSVGQRVIEQMDVAGDQVNRLSFVLSPVTTIGYGQCKGLYYHKALNAKSISQIIGYRTSNFSVDPNAGLSAFFATFTFVDTNINDLSAIFGVNQVQIVTLFSNANPICTNASQIIEGYLLYTPINEMSDKWVGSVDNSTQGGASPAYTAFRLVSSDSGTKYFYAYDDNGNLVASANTSANYANFSKTTNNGLTWSTMSGPNDYSSTPLTTEIRYNWSNPPGVRVTCSLRDS